MSADALYPSFLGLKAVGTTARLAMRVASSKGLVQGAEFQAVCFQAILRPNAANAQLRAHVFDVIAADVRWG